MLLEYPLFYPDFACIGKTCKDSCCKDWLIDIDFDTAEKYQKMGGALGEKLRKKLHKKDGEFYFEVEKDGRCPFLQQDGLCEIQKERGEEELSKVCDAYPRKEYIVHPYMQLDLHLSCEEAAKAILSWKGELIREELEDERISEVEDIPENGFDHNGRNELLVSLLAFRQGLWEALPDFPKDIHGFFAELKTVFLQGEELLFYENKAFPYDEELEALENGLRSSFFSEESFREYCKMNEEIQGRGELWKSFLTIFHRAEKDLQDKMQSFYREGEKLYLEELCRYYTFRYLMTGLKKKSILPLFHLIRKCILWMAYTDSLLQYYAKEEEKQLFFFGEEKAFFRVAVFFSKEVEHQKKNMDLFLE